jgi:hypothetical protein
MKDEDKSVCAISLILIYRGSLSGYARADFHQACDGMGKCIVFVKGENGRIAAAYNEDASIDEEGAEISFIEMTRRW